MDGTTTTSSAGAAAVPPSMQPLATEGKTEMKETPSVGGAAGAGASKPPMAAAPGAGKTAAAASGNGANKGKGNKKKKNKGAKTGNGDASASAASSTPSSSSAESSPAVSPAPPAIDAVADADADAAAGGADAPTPATLVGWAQRLVAHDMGLKDAELLDEGFFFLGPFDGPIGKAPFLEGSKGFDLRGAFPDFDFQAHDFRVDAAEPLRVWFTTRKAGTHKGPLPMYGQTIAPTLKTLDFPPEAYSATFNAEGKCVKLTGGFVMDATQGNSHGLGGPLGIAAAVGKPLSAFRHQPPVPALLSLLLPKLAALPLVGSRVLPESAAKPPVPAPLPSTTSLGKAELLALARAWVEKGDGAEGEGMLAPDFMHYDPLEGWTTREAFVARRRAHDLHAAFPDDLEVRTYNFRVDPYAPATVWFTRRATGTHTGAGLGGGRLAVPPATGRRYESPPEEISLTFADQSKQLIRMTAGAVLDRGQGNTGGLGGLHGVFYALGRPSLPALTRPLRFQSVGEWKTALLQSCATPVVATVPLLRRAAGLVRVLPYLDMEAQDHSTTTATATEEGEGVTGEGQQQE